MGLRFRKSFNFGGARINVSKKGVGGSIGVKGARVTAKAGGGTRSTVGIPNTGISYVKESGKGKNKSSGNEATQSSSNRNHFPYFTFAAVLKVLGILMIALSALLTLALPVVGFIGIAIGIGELLLSKYNKKKGMEQAIEEEEIARLEAEEAAPAAK